MKKIIINSQFTGHQKFMLSIGFIFTFTIGGFTLFGITYCLIKGISTDVADYIFLLLFPLSIFLFMLLLSKQGIIINNGELKYSQFIFKHPFMKKNIDITNVTDVCIILSNGTQKLAFVFGGNPDLAVNIESYRIFLLNKNHSSKLELITTRKSDLADQVIKGLTDELNLEYNTYNPPVVARRR
jgi:hypothetical protein